MTSEGFVDPLLLENQKVKGRAGENERTRVT
jgi:hypothetical protein